MLTKEEYIKRCQSKHINEDGEPLYKYDKCEYNGVDGNHIKINCPIHGDFTLNPKSHLYYGAGCPICRSIKYNESNKHNIEQSIRNNGIKFIEKAKNHHSINDKPIYNYDKVKYINSYAKVIITCLVHGDFLQSPNSHLNGAGCPECASDRRKTR